MVIVPSQGSKGALARGGKTKINDKKYPKVHRLVVTNIKLETKKYLSFLTLRFSANLSLKEFSNSNK